MQVTVQLPDNVARQIATAAGDVPRRVLEAVAIEGYRSEQLSRGQISEMLDLSFWETEAFLNSHGAMLHYSRADLEQDARSNERVLKK